LGATALLLSDRIIEIEDNKTLSNRKEAQITGEAML